MHQSMTSSAAIEREHDDGYPALEKLVAGMVAQAKYPLFTTSATDLFQTFLDNLPPDRRQHYTCHACRRFVDKYGPVVEILESGQTMPILWAPINEVPAFFRDAIGAVYMALTRAKVTGVFLSSEKTWGTPRTGEWTHLSGTNANIWTSRLQTADQAMAEKLQDFIMLKAGLAEFSAETVQQAVRVLKSDTLSRSEKTLGIAEWLLKLHVAIAAVPKRLQDNIVWRAVATAPPGFCHVRSTMINTLLDDIVAGLPFESIASRWASKMHPLQYQRPTAPPSEGAVKQAEKLVETLQTAGSLDRRFAMLSDVVAFWKPSPVAEKEQKAGGVFGHLLQKKASPTVELPVVTMTWHKFRTTVLPDAAEMHALAPDSGQYVGLVTAVNPDAPPILQWDGLEGHPRNAVSWYFYNGGSLAKNWNLAPRTWVKVNAVCAKPCAWQQPEKFKHQGEDAFLILEGAKDLRHEQGGSFFPECLRSEYHGIRSVMEAYAGRAKIAGKDAGTANGLAVKGGSVTIQVKSSSGTARYTIDRWD